MSALKTLGWITVGLVAGLFTMYLLRDTGASHSEPERTVVGAPSRAGENNASATELAAVLDRLAQLESEIAEVSAGLAELRAAQPPASTVTPAEPDFPQRMTRTLDLTPSGATLVEPQQPNRSERLVQGGFTPFRADWILEREQAIFTELLQARYDAERSGAPGPPADFAESTLRSELGDAEYGQYLEALGRPSSVPLLSVLPDAPAALAGLRPQDEIVSYAGKRVFSADDLMGVMREGTPGESVTVEVDRGGTILQFSIPRGPLGVSFSVAPVISMPSIEPR